jgi:hypothetical protein
MTAYGLLSLADHLADPVSGLRTTQAERYGLIDESDLRPRFEENLRLVPERPSALLLPIAD